MAKKIAGSLGEALVSEVQHAGHDHSGAGHSGVGHSGHGHAGHDHSTSGDNGAGSWRMAATATLHCLTGCAIGEVVGMVLGSALGWHNAATVLASIVLAFVFGYGLTMRGVLRAGIGLRQAVSVALAADTVSIATMELLDNAFILAVPGAIDATLSSPLFWLSLAGSLVVAFVVTTPVNRALIARGKGHAVVHTLHAH